MRSARELAKEYGRHLGEDYPVGDSVIEWLLEKQHADMRTDMRDNDDNMPRARNAFWARFIPGQQYGPDPVLEPVPEPDYVDKIETSGEVVTFSRSQDGLPIVTCALPKIAADAIRADERARLGRS